MWVLSSCPMELKLQQTLSQNCLITLAEAAYGVAIAKDIMLCPSDARSSREVYGRQEELNCQGRCKCREVSTVTACQARMCGEPDYQKGYEFNHLSSVYLLIYLSIQSIHPLYIHSLSIHRISLF